MYTFYGISYTSYGRISKKNASITRNYFFHRKTYTLWKVTNSEPTSYGRILHKSFHNYYHLFPYNVYILWNFIYKLWKDFKKNASITRNYFFHRKTYTLWKFLYTNYGRISLKSFHNFYYFFPYLVHILWNFHLQVMEGFSKNPSITCIFLSIKCIPFMENIYYKLWKDFPKSFHNLYELFHIKYTLYGITMNKLWKDFPEIFP